MVANGVSYGEFNLLRRSDGDYWMLADDMLRLKVAPLDAARRSWGAESFFSLKALGATGLDLNEAELLLKVQFPVRMISGTEIDLLTLPKTPPLTRPPSSLILSYQLSWRPAIGGQPQQVVADTDLNVRIGPLLLRQEMRLNSAPQVNEKRASRGFSQVVWDDPARAIRVTAGDVLSTAGPFGTTITGAGLMLQKAYEINPDVIRYPLANVRAGTALPADVEVAVDGQPILRTRVGPGPISINNLLMYGGTRDIRVTVTDITGRREVFEQPFLFTDAVLAKGMHEYSYFLGKRSEIGATSEPDYREAAWQGYHRYGVNDTLTIGAGGEGSRSFATLGLGLTARLDRLGLIGLDVLTSTDRERDVQAHGWSGRYTYVLPGLSFSAGRRSFGAGFRTFTTSVDSPFVRNESRVGVATQLWAASLALELSRRSDARESRNSAALRMSTALSRGVSLSAELQRRRLNDKPEWLATVFLRAELGPRSWFGSSIQTDDRSHRVAVETGRQVGQGEGFGYRIGTHSTTSRQAGSRSDLAYGSAQWNLRPATLEFFGSSQLSGGNAQYALVSASGAIVGTQGEWGLTRRVTDSFVVARLGVPVEGVEISLNNQVHGTTDGSGRLFLPGVGAYGRQDLSLNDKQLGLQYNLSERRRTISLPYRSGVVVDFGGRKIRAIAGMAWLAGGPIRKPIASRAWTLSAPAGTLSIETGRAGDFYVEDAQPGRYTGRLEAGGRTYACRLDVPDFSEVVHEIEEGVICE